MANTVKERMGLRVVKNTLREDWLHDGSWGAATFEGVTGKVEIEVLPSCILRDDLILSIAEMIAAEEASDTLPRNISVTDWNISREGNRIKAVVFGADDLDPDTRLTRNSSEFAMRQRPLEGY